MNSRSQKAVSTRQHRQKHTILFLAANPSGTDRLALDLEARAIQAELERSGWRDHFELVTRWAAEPLDLLRELRKTRPTVVHFSGHSAGAAAAAQWSPSTPRDVAMPGSDKDAQCHGLYFQGADGAPRVVSATALREAFGAAGSSVKLVVLNACYSDAAAVALLTYVDFVVGMARAIGDDAARSFAIGFYGGLGERASIAAAHRNGCAAIGLDGFPDADCPQLRVRQGIHPSTVVLADLARQRASRRARAFVALGVVAVTGAAGLGLRALMLSVAPEQFEVTVFLHGEAGDQDIAIRNRGKVVLDLAADKRVEAVGDHGEVRFPGVPASLRGQEVGVALIDDTYELANAGARIRLDHDVFHAAVRAKRLRLTGQVRDDRGRPVAHARASIAGAEATTDEVGRFEVMLPADLPEGDRTIMIVAPGYEIWRGQAVPGGNLLQASLSASGDGP